MTSSFPVQKLISLNCIRSRAGPPKSIAPVRPFPIGKASLSQSSAGLSYFSIKSAAVADPRSDNKTNTVVKQILLRYIPCPFLNNPLSFNVLLGLTACKSGKGINQTRLPVDGDFIRSVVVLD